MKNSRVSRSYYRTRLTGRQNPQFAESFKAALATVATPKAELRSTAMQRHWDTYNDAPMFAFMLVSLGLKVEAGGDLLTLYRLPCGDGLSVMTRKDGRITKVYATTVAGG